MAVLFPISLSVTPNCFMCSATTSRSNFGIFSAPLAPILNVSLPRQAVVLYCVAVMGGETDCSRAVSNNEAKLLVALSKTQREMTCLLHRCCVV